MTITIHGTNIELTDPLRQYAEDKIKGLDKYFENIIKAEIDIGLTSHHHQKGKIYYAEVNLHIPKTIVRVSKEAVDLYKAIDKVRDHLKVELQKYKGKMRNRDKKDLRQQKTYQI